ncbi:DUF4270 domain-containing protein [Desertivirga xinjiangensis]|uniref:DUF4270 domain-containing protein n=1 Tax=Desertivirga xinjiangensis TaxID=539206 RepID=UPI00210CF4E9|nr:DUF4270 domain-containing protein [Pedobacter xinjiangensis]
MKYFKRDLFFLCINLIIFSSCQKSDLVGLGVDPDNLIKSDLEVTSVNAFTEKEDSLITTGSSRHAFGYLVDPVFGTTQASIALGLSLPSDGFSFGTSPELDSAVLVLKYGNEFYGDSTKASTFPIEVHQLTERYNSSASYYNTKNWAYNNSVISKNLVVSHFPWRDSSRSVFQIIDGIQDTAVKVLPQLRIPLDETFIRDKIMNASAANLASNTAFSNYFKGLYVTVKPVAATNPGGLIFFDLQTTDVSRLEIYYRNVKDDNSKDTNMVAFGFSNTTASSKIVHTFSTDIEQQLDNPGSGSEVVYSEALGGLRTRLHFPDDELNKIKAFGEIAVNKAELIVTEVLPQGSGTVLAPAARLALYRTDIAGVRKPVPDNAIGMDARYLPEILFGGFYNKDTRKYSFIITSYIQDLLSGRLKQYDTYLAPIARGLTGSSNISPSAITAGRTVLAGSTNSNPDYRMKLKVYYTRPD